MLAGVFEHHGLVDHGQLEVGGGIVYGSRPFSATITMKKASEGQQVAGMRGEHGIAPIRSATPPD